MNTTIKTGEMVNKSTQLQKEKMLNDMSKVKMNKSLENHLRKQISIIEVELRDKIGFLKRVIDVEYYNTEEDWWLYINPLHEEIENLIGIKKFYLKQLPEHKLKLDIR